MRTVGGADESVGGLELGTCLGGEGAGFRDDVAFCRDLGVLAAADASQLLALLGPTFPFGEAVALGQSIHVHVTVDDLDALPHGRIRERALLDVAENPAFVKYCFPGGLNVVFSPFPTAEDDFIDGAVTLEAPFVDHLGIDVRDDTPASRAVFDAVPQRALQAGWRHVHQGGGERAVHCCYAEVPEKRWVYPPDGVASSYRPMEFAFGALTLHEHYVGCDYRPIDPAHPLAAQAGDVVGRCSPPASAGPDSSALPATGRAKVVTTGTTVKRVHIFEESSCASGPGRPLADLLARRYADMAEVRVFDLANPGTLVPLPPELFIELDAKGSKCLPAFVVNGRICTTGWLPKFSDAVTMVDSGGPTTRALSKSAALTGEESCCSPGTQCC